LAEETFLGDDFLRQLMSVGEVDLLVAIPTFNNADTIGQTIQAIEESYQQNFIRDRVVILNVDGGSTDKTPEIVCQSDGHRGSGRGITSLRTVHRVTSRYAESPSPAKALRTVVAAADLLRAKACAVVSPNTVNVEASWIANLLRPAYRQDFDYVAPLYVRNKYQGLLARNLLYPMARAVFGRRIREVYSDEWAFSGRLAAECLAQNIWNDEAIRARPEAWMAITGIRANMKCCQSFLGPKVAPHGTAPDIVDAIRQTIGNLFRCLEIYQDDWLAVDGSQAVPTFGSDHEITTAPKPAGQEKVFDLFCTGVNDLKPVLPSILGSDTYAKIQDVAALGPGKFHFPLELWVTTVYEFAAAYHRTVIARDHIVQALVPLYRGSLYSFVQEHADSSPEQIEVDTETLCGEFERQKPYLVERWKAKS
jgi:hypothetical protein